MQRLRRCKWAKLAFQSIKQALTIKKFSASVLHVIIGVINQVICNYSLRSLCMYINCNFNTLGMYNANFISKQTFSERSVNYFIIFICRCKSPSRKNLRHNKISSTFCGSFALILLS